MRRDILEYLWRRFPQHCIVLTDPRMLRVIDLGIRRAEAQRFTEPEQVGSWILLMMFFGSYFDEDPLHGWAEAALADVRDNEDRAEAMAMLFERMNEATDPFLGDDATLYREALERTGRIKFETLLRDTEGSHADALRRWLHVAYPARLASLTTEGFEQLTSTSLEWAREYGLIERPGAILCMLLIALFGSRVNRDPLNPWVADALEKNTTTDAAEKTRAMHHSLHRMQMRFAALERFAGEFT